jgi:hypothetical protein
MMMAQKASNCGAVLQISGQGLTAEEAAVLAILRTRLNGGAVRASAA